ncbi:MAG: response regulator [Thermodesulfobacteriota bacterium]
MELNRKRLVFFSRLLVIITIAYIMVLAPAGDNFRLWGYGFIAFYLATNLIIHYLPDRFFSHPAVFYCIVLVDCVLIVTGIYLSGMEGSDLYLIFFVIVCLATLGSELRNLIIASVLFVMIYGWLLYRQGLLQGDMAVSYCLRLPFILVVALFLGYIVDLQSRAQKERLAASENRYRVFVNKLPVGIYQQTIGDNSRFLLMNNCFFEMFGYDRKDLQGKETDAIYARQEQRQDMFRRLEREKHVEGFSLDLRRRDGSVFNGTVWARKYNDDNREIIEGVIIDVTELKEAENALKAMERQLQQAQKMEAIGVLAGGVAHNFNNNLMSILGHVSAMLLDRKPSDPDYEPLRSISLAIREAASLTRNLLGFARGGAYEVLPLDLNELVVNEDRIFSSASKSVRIHEQLGESLWAVEADRSQLQQVMMNLYVNAAQAMTKTGSGDIFVSTANVLLDESIVRSHHLPPGRYVKIAVRDTGCGMDETVMGKIFDPFFTTKMPGEGTGLGLSSVYGIIKNHNGFIEVDSRPMQGSVFTIYLPATDKIVVRDDERPPEEVKKGSGVILVVDDEEMVLKSCERLLKRLNYHVLTAQNGLAAMDIYRERGQNVDLVMLDMLMPEMSGGVIFERLKEMNPDIKVLLSSGYSLNEQARDILSRGCRGFIQKPFDVGELSKKITEIISGQERGTRPVQCAGGEKCRQQPFNEVRI